MPSAKENERGLVDRLVDFMHFARRRGLPISVQQGLDLIEAVKTGVMCKQASFYFATKAICCIAKEQFGLFDKLFEIYWLGKQDEEGIIPGATILKGQEHTPKQQGTLVMWGKGESSSATEPSKTVLGAHAKERLMKVDFSKVEEMEVEWLEDLAYQLWLEMSKRLKKRVKAHRGKHIVNLRRTIRKSLEQGGEPLRLLFKENKPKKNRLILFLDISGSMEKYSFILLRFIYALQQHFEKVESFLFSTQLERITDSIQDDSIRSNLKELSEKVKHWSSGTRIGYCLKQFNDLYAKDMLSRRTIVMILSDGLDTGEPGDLGRELENIALRSKDIIWLNPLKGTDSYTPAARGMSEALPHIDHFRSAHNLESILELENLLAYA
ncbi:MAG: VWA domain-containing protein [Saprospiraceae bacterium]|nr:VWA domain-containing protein [Saprospiraceae bacterium]